MKVGLQAILSSVSENHRAHSLFGRWGITGSRLGRKMREIINEIPSDELVATPVATATTA